jgi:hypothetical protein
MRFTPLFSSLLVLALVLVPGCGGSASRRSEGKHKQVPELQNGAKTTPSWQGRLGRIVLVNTALDFALVDIGTSPAPEAGTRLKAYNGSELSAELSVSAHQQRPFLIADILSGSPRVSDMVVPVKKEPKLDENRTSAAAKPEQDKIPAPPAKLPRQSPIPEPTGLEDPVPRERRPPPSTRTLLNTGNLGGDESEAIIPGLPASGKLPSR